MDPLDRAEPVQGGHALDLGRLAERLAREGLSGPIELEQFTRGYSNVTYLLRASGRELVLRRPPSGVRIETAHDMSREFRILSALHDATTSRWSKVPKPLFLETNPEVLGVPFYVMERVRGVILRARPPEGLELQPSVMRRVSETTVDTLADIHALDVEAVGLSDLGKPAGYVERQVRGWTRRYEKAKTDDVQDADVVARWLDDHRPVESGACLVHNDFKYDNLILDPKDLGRVLAVLDWEMATIGDPLMDLGCTLGYWTQSDDPPHLLGRAFGLTYLPGNLSREGVIARYAERTGRDVSNAPYYFVFGIFKIAVVGQQLYQRHVRGLTSEPKYAGLGDAVRALMRTARTVAERGRVDRLD